MTCAECREALLTADLRSAVSSDAHLRECEQCARIAETLVVAQNALAESLADVEDRRVAFDAIASFAFTRVRRERVMRRILVPVALVLVVLAGVAITRTIPEIKRLTDAPPTVETRVFSLRCLSGEQAASILRPYLPLPQNPRWQAEMFDVRPTGQGLQAVTVRAPASTLAIVPSVLERFENDPRAACRL